MQPHPAGERLVVELHGKGVDWLRTTIDLYAGVPRVDVRYQLGKQPTAAKEAVFFAFPFAVDGPPAAWELTGGVGGTGVPSVPGSAEHMRPIRHWVAFEDPELTVAWATLEAPLVQFGSIHMPYAPFPPTLDEEDGTVYSWALNNIWDTNFPSQQQGETTFRYAFASGAAGSGRRSAPARPPGSPTRSSPPSPPATCPPRNRGPSCAWTTRTCSSPPWAAPGTARGWPSGSSRSPPDRWRRACTCRAPPAPR
ncbi:hypothetical protein ACFQY7_52330 [Actinomadura luteofluorescens]|uniref:hypothetical protein n=1 Tax=Actinomadura luteofluorescens TaxID=46163 RepID=UPI0036454AE9